jgi:hypothetical protein
LPAATLPYQLRTISLVSLVSMTFSSVATVSGGVSSIVHKISLDTKRFCNLLFR